MLNVEYSPPRRGGGAAASIKSCEATGSAAAGVVRSAKSSGLNRFAELTTPAAPFWNGSIFIYGASTPPLRGGEYSTFNISSIRSHLLSCPASQRQKWLYLSRPEPVALCRPSP